MRITRFPQSCLLIEHNNRTLVIDPGDDFLKTHREEELDEVEAVLYTHQHSDHFLLELAKYLAAREAEIVCNIAVAQIAKDEIKTTIVGHGDTFTAAGMQVQAIELPHCLLPGGSEGPLNTGYVIEGVFFHPGDGYSLAGTNVSAMALPITGPDISMKDAFLFAKQMEAKTVIPIHYDKLGAKPEIYKAMAENLNMPFEMRVLADGESMEI